MSCRNMMLLPCLLLLGVTGCERSNAEPKQSAAIPSACELISVEKASAILGSPVRVGRSNDNKDANGQIINSMCNWESAEDASTVSFGVMINQRHDRQGASAALLSHYDKMGQELGGEMAEYELISELGQGAGYQSQAKQLTVFRAGHWFIFTLFYKPEAEHKARIVALAKEVLRD